MSIFFIGGWATDREQFPWFAEHSEFYVPFADFEPEDVEKVLHESIRNSSGNILIGWSTGAHIILKFCQNIFTEFEKVILISPFLRFTDSFPVRIVESMIKGLNVDPDSVVDQFHANCGESGKFKWNYGTVRLRRGLEFLIDSEIDKVDASSGNVILVRGENDKIVRRKAFERVTSVMPEVEVLAPCFGHKPDELYILNILGDSSK